LANLPGAGFFTGGKPLDAMLDAPKSPFSKLLGKIPGGGVTAAIGGASVLAGLLSKQQMAEIDEADPDERGDIVAEKLRQSLTRLGVSGEELERRVAEGVSEYTGYTSKAEGGRIGFDMGSPRQGISSLAGPGDLLAAPTDLELSSDGIVMEGKSKPLDFNFNDIVEELKEKKNKPVLFTDGITYYPEYNTFLDSDANEVSGPSEGAIPIEEQRLKDAASGSKYLEAAEGGRIGYAAGSDDEFPLGDPTAPVNPFGPKPTGPVLPNKMMASNMENDKILEALFEKYLDMGLSPEKAAEEAKKEFERMSMMQTEGRGLAAMGGRMNYALGDTASQNAMQAAGIEGLPVRQNPKGVKELDLRDNGGFIPPVGIKEKEDDIPAMLSNNEFVFTADAVRGMGDGDVELGAQRMYDQMKMLEKGGRV